MARPALGSFAEELYRRLEPFHSHTKDGVEYTDEKLGWPLLAYFGSMAALWQRLDDITTDSEAGPAWSSVVDIDRIEDAGLNYLGQFKGVVPLEGLTPDQQRDRIRYVDGFNRCTSESLRIAAKRRLVTNDPVTQNLVSDPSNEGASYIGTSGCVGVTETIAGVLTNLWSRSGAKSARFAGQATAGVGTHLLRYATGQINGIEALETYTFSSYFNIVDSPTAGALSVTLQREWINASNTVFSTAANSISISSFGVSRPSVTSVAPAGAVAVKLTWYMNVDPSDTYNLYQDDWMMSKGALIDYFDGDTDAPDGYTIYWDATPYASSSTLALITDEDPTVIINERIGDNALQIGVITLIEETPDPIGTFRDLMEQKPWGYILTYEVLDAWNYTALQIAFDDYGEIQAHYADYEGVQENDPPAI